MDRTPLDLFSSTVPYYARFRSGYPGAEVDALAARLGVNASCRVLDVGCGCGQLAIPLARHAGHVIAVDPLQVMLDRGRLIAPAAGVDNITWVRGDSQHLEELVAPGAQAAFFAASFHWTDRSTVAESLDELLAPSASIVVINDVLSEPEQPDWTQAVAEIRRVYLGTDPAETDRYINPVRSHQEMLIDSPFSSVDRSMWSWTRQLTVDEVVGLQFSYSFSSSALLGDRANAFADDVRAAVRVLHPNGVVIEPFRVEVLVAVRPR